MKVSIVQLPSAKRDLPSLEAAYLASSLHMKGHDVDRYEFNLKLINPEWKKSLERINQQYSSDVIDAYIRHSRRPCKFAKYTEYCVDAIDKNSNSTVFIVNSFNLTLSAIVAYKLKKASKGMHIIFENINTLYMDNLSDYLLKNIGVDYIVLGEGDRKIPGLIETHDPTLWPDIVYLEDNIMKRSMHIFDDTDIDNYPLPIFQKKDINSALFKNILPILSSRGCVGKCNFCGIPASCKHYRQRSADSIIIEMKSYDKEFNIRTFKFNDYCLNNNQEFLPDFCKKINQTDLDVFWGGNIKVNRSLDRNLFMSMYKSGCRFLVFGIESGSQRVLDMMQKQIEIQIAERNIRDASASGIIVETYFIVGYPGETMKDFHDTIDFIVKNQDYIKKFNIRPFHLNQYSSLEWVDISNLISENKKSNRIKYMIEYFEAEKHITFELKSKKYSGMLRFENPAIRADKQNLLISLD